MDTRTLPEKIDLAQWASNEASFKGLVPLNEFVRLSQTLLEQSGPLREGEQEILAQNDQLSVEVAGQYTRSGLPIINVKLTAKVVLRCQRCLQPFLYPIDSEFAATYEGVDEERLSDDCELGELDEEGQFALLSLVEDELLLSIPVAAKHSVDCVAAEQMTAGQVATGEATKNKPKGLETLASLKKQFKQH